MSVEQVCLEIKRGDSKSYTLFFTDENSVPLDITGYTLFFTVKEKLDDVDTSAKISYTITTFTSPTTGEAVINLTPSNTNLIGSYLFDIQIKDTAGNITTILEGIINFSRDVTLREI